MDTRDAQHKLSIRNSCLTLPEQASTSFRSRTTTTTTISTTTIITTTDRHRMRIANPGHKKTQHQTKMPAPCLSHVAQLAIVCLFWHAKAC
jgi:hypothetical protein